MGLFPVESQIAGGGRNGHALPGRPGHQRLGLAELREHALPAFFSKRFSDRSVTQTIICASEGRNLAAADRAAGAQTAGGILLVHRHGAVAALVAPGDQPEIKGPWRDSSDLTLSGPRPGTVPLQRPGGSYQ